MADKNWRQSKEIQQAKAVAAATGADAVILITINGDDDGGVNVQLATYGVTGPICTLAGQLGDAAHAAVMKGLA